MPKRIDHTNSPTTDPAAAANPMVSMLQGSQNVEEVNAAQSAIIQPTVKVGVSPAGSTIAGNNFSPADIEHLVTTAQEPPTQQDLEVEAELQRLAQAKARKA